METNLAHKHIMKTTRLKFYMKKCKKFTPQIITLYAVKSMPNLTKFQQSNSDSNTPPLNYVCEGIIYFYLKHKNYDCLLTKCEYMHALIQMSTIALFYLYLLPNIINKRAQRALDRSPETKDFKFPFFIALSTTGDTWQSKS